MMKSVGFLAVGIFVLISIGTAWGLRYEDPPGEGEPCFLSESEERLSLYKRYIDRGIRFFRKGLYPEAKDSLWQAINLYPKNPDAYINLSIVHMAEENYDTAIRILQDAQTMAPPDYFQQEILLYNLGLAYFNKGNYQEAIDYFSKSLAVYPEFAEAVYYLSLSYEKTGQSQKAQAIRERLEKQLQTMAGFDGQAP